jgi:hypothetical protein
MADNVPYTYIVLIISVLSDILCIARVREGWETKNLYYLQ